MKFTFLSLLILSVTVILSSSTCTVLQSTLNLWMSVNETHKWELQKIIEGKNLTYSLSSSNAQFEIQKPISIIGNPNPHIEAIDRIVGTRAYLQNNLQIQMISFVFIESQLGTLDLFYSDQAQYDSSPPSFKNKINIPIENSYIQCYGVEYISFDLYILDCINATKLPFTNLFMLQHKQGGNPQIFENQNINKYQYISKRIIQAINLVNKFDELSTYIFRTTPAYAVQDGKLDNSSILEIFEIGYQNQPILLTYLDSKKITELFQISDPDNFKFSIIEFKVQSDNTLEILTSTDGIYIVKFSVDGQFEKISHIKIDSTDLALSFAILEQYDRYFILYQNYFMKIDEYGYNQEKIYLGFTAKYPDYLSFSGKFLVIYSGGIVHLLNPFSIDFQISQEILEGVKALIINPIQPELLSITQIDARKYELSSGFLKFNGKLIESTTKIIQLNATDSIGEYCSSNIFYQVLNSNNYSLIKTQNIVFPEIQYDLPTPYLIDSLASGPNQNFIKLESEELEININQLHEIKLNYIDIISQQNINFVKSMTQNENEGSLLLLTQNNLNEIYINVCRYRQTNLDAYCEQFQHFKLSINLNQLNFAWRSQSKNNIQLITLDNEFLATIRIITPTKVIESFQISYNNIMTHKITSVTLIQTGICFFLKMMNYIDIWSITAPAQLNYRIDKNVFFGFRIQ